jgi:regulator of protease activity HflC (stomatin/prohibitin superfamily)
MNMDFADFLRGFVALLWLVVVVLFVLAIVQASRNQRIRGINTAIIVASILAILMTTVSAGLVFIPPEQRGVVISAIEPNGYREQALQPGLRWIIPYFESVETYSISRQTYTMSIVPLEGQVQGDDSVTARTSDGQEILMDASVIYAINPQKVVNLHITWQKRYIDELVRPLSRGVIRNAVAKYGVEEVYSSQRTEMIQEIIDELVMRFDENGLIMEDFILRNITFSPEYAASVEQKQIAEQQAQQAKFVVEQRKQEAQQAIETARGQAESVKIRAQGEADARIIQAEAEAQALLLLAQAVEDKPDLLSYQYINKLAPGIRVMLVPNNAPYLLPLADITSPDSVFTTTEVITTTP